MFVTNCGEIMYPINGQIALEFFDNQHYHILPDALLIPDNMTVQEPHPPRPHPSLLPVRCTCHVKVNIKEDIQGEIGRK